MRFGYEVVRNIDACFECGFATANLPGLCGARRFTCARGRGAKSAEGRRGHSPVGSDQEPVACGGAARQSINSVTPATREQLLR